MADYGPHWKDHRRFALMTLRNFGLGKQSMEERILEEISYLVADLDKNAGISMQNNFDKEHAVMLLTDILYFCPGGTVNPQNMFHNVASNVIGLVLFGSRFDYKNEFLQHYVQFITEVSKILNGPWNVVRI